MSEPVGNESRLRRGWRWVAGAWLAVVLALLAHQASFWSAPQLDGDILALLPGERSDALLAAANRQIADAATRRVVVMLRGKAWAETHAAARVFAATLPEFESGLIPAADAQAGASALTFYRPFRDRLLTADQRERLRTAEPTDLAQQALVQLFGPSVSGAITAWRADPLALWPQWWQQRLGPNIGQRDGMTTVQEDNHTWIVLPYEVGMSSFRINGKATLQTALDRAGAEAGRVAPGLDILRAGVPLHAEAAAVRANWEINTIGLGSLLAVIVLMWLAFRSLRPVAMVFVSLLVGWTAGVSATALAFPKVHLLTLVFGASLLGVAVDYGMHYFASRQARAHLGSYALMRRLLPALSLAWVTSALAYLALGAAPFPGLRQMAVFSSAGLAAAFLTVACWFPVVDRGTRARTRFAELIAASLVKWPRFRRGTRSNAWTIPIAAILVLLGLLRLDVRDDLRSLQSSPASLLDQQRRIAALMALPSPAQFYLVQGDSAEQVLQREEALKARLGEQVAAGGLQGYRATSDWVPSLARQHADAALTARVERQLLRQVSEVVGEPVARAEFASGDILIDAWLRQPESAPFRAGWLGQLSDSWASVVMLDGIGPASDLALFRQQAAAVPGVRWVDRTADISRLLGHYRAMMGGLLLASFAAVALVLAIRYRRMAWRALLPTGLAGVLTLAALAWIGEPLQLFTVLALLLLLGMGIDYGIFLLEHRGDGASWLAVSLGAASTLLSFGLLSLSATPALRSFGLTLLFGIGLVWLLSPLFRPPAHEQAPDMPTDSHDATH